MVCINIQFFKEKSEIAGVNYHGSRRSVGGAVEGKNKEPSERNIKKIAKGMDYFFISTALFRNRFTNFSFV